MARPELCSQLMLPLIKVLEAPPPKTRQPMPEEIDIDDKEDEEVRSANVRRREEGEGGGGGRGVEGRREKGGGGGSGDGYEGLLHYLHVYMLNFALVPRCSVPCIRTLCNSFLQFFSEKEVSENILGQEQGRNPQAAI